MKKETTKQLSQSFIEDSIWMSYRYCIGRGTIAAHCRAEDIATETYDLVSDKRKSFNSRDINDSIRDQFNFRNFVDFGWHGNIPNGKFRPLDLVYQTLSENNVDTNEKFKNIKQIEIDWDYASQRFKKRIIWKKHDEIFKDISRSLHDVFDLECWQQLANLFDVDNHKIATLVDGTQVECYTCWQRQHIASKDLYLYEEIVKPIYGWNKFIPKENISKIEDIKK